MAKRRLLKLFALDDLVFKLSFVSFTGLSTCGTDHFGPGYPVRGL